MTKTLLLMRHAEAGTVPTSSRDFDRPLTPRGEAMPGSLGQHLQQKNIVPQKILCSPALRTRQTEKFLIEAWEEKPETVFEDSFYGAGPEHVLHLIQREGETENLLIIGHNPWIHMLVLSLCAPEGLMRRGEIKSMYPPCACASLQFNVDEWSQVTGPRGTLIDFYYPGTLHG